MGGFLQSCNGTSLGANGSRMKLRHRRSTPDEAIARLRLRLLEARAAHRYCNRKLWLLRDGGHDFAAAYVEDCAAYQMHYAEALDIVLNPPRRGH